MEHCPSMDVLYIRPYIVLDTEDAAVNKTNKNSCSNEAHTPLIPIFEFSRTSLLYNMILTCELSQCFNNNNTYRYNPL